MNVPKHLFAVSLVSLIILTSSCQSGQQPAASTSNLAAEKQSGEDTNLIEIYVSPKGKDSNPGTFDKPLRTFAGAKKKVRKIEGKDITVYFRGGYYRFDEPVTLNIKDSGSEHKKIKYCAYKKETPVFGSGVQVTGWEKIKETDAFYDALPEKAKSKCFAAEVPTEAMDNPYRKAQLRVLLDRKGGWLERAWYSIDNKIKTGPHGEYSGSTEAGIYYPARYRTVCQLTTDVTDLAMPADAMDLKTWLSDWNISMAPIKTIEKSKLGSKLIIKYPAAYMLSGGARKYHEDLDFVESCLLNAPEGIDGPGKWVVNPHSGKIYLWPYENTELEKDLYVPALNQLINLQGDLPEGKDAWLTDEPVIPIRNITFEGITFTECDYLPHTAKDPMVQHGWAVCDKDNALLRFRGAKLCTVKDCEFIKSGGVGIRFDLYAQNNKVTGCLFENLGAEAVHFGGYGAGKRDENKNNIFTKNEIGFPGRIKGDAHAVTVWQSGFNKITENYVHDTPYTPVLLAGPRFRVLIRKADEAVPFHKEFFMQEGAWEMIRWDEIPEIATFTASMAEDEGRDYLIHKPHPEHPAYPRPGPHPVLDYHCGPFRHTQGNVVQYNTFENVSSGPFGEVIYISGTTEPGVRNVFSDNYICNCTDAAYPIIWILYVDAYGRGIEMHRNIIYNVEVWGMGLHNAFWNTYNGWTWGNYFYPKTRPPQGPTANLFCDSEIPDLIAGEPLPEIKKISDLYKKTHIGTIAVNCKTREDDSKPMKVCTPDYKTMLENVEERNFPHPSGELPGEEKIKTILQETINKLR